MEYLLALSLLGNVGLAVAALRALQLRDESSRAERAQLINRIQAPQVLPPETLPVPDGHDKYVPAFDDDAYDRYLEERS